MLKETLIIVFVCTFLACLILGVGLIWSLATAAFCTILAALIGRFLCGSWEL